MKKMFVILFIFVAFGLLSITKVHAGLNTNVIESPIGLNLTELGGRISGLFQPIIMLTFLGVAIYGGYVRMTAGADADAEARGIKILTSGIVGFIIIVLAPVIVSLVQQILGLTSSF